MSGPGTIDIGTLQQDQSIPAYINVDDMVRKHFAVFGTTGVGKSSGVALLVRQILDARPDLRVFLIDPHNEYGHCFDDRAQVLSPKNLKLPFWVFNFEEIVDVFFRGRPGVDEEVEILSELMPIAKSIFTPNNGPATRRIVRNDPKSSGVTVDTPVPYRLEDLIRLIDERMGKLENRSAWARYHRLITRIETARNDPRYGFMFDNANVGGDTMVETLSTLFRLPPNGMPMTIMQLAGFPAEVVDSVVSVLLRMAFEFGLWSDGAFPLLCVCEEAHRYAPADRSVGFGPTRKAVSRIAKEGRKYGVFLGLITQRPAELDATIISQCSTLFAMRMANDRDQAIVRSAVSDAAGSLIGFVPSLGTREVFAFGEGVALPTRLRFKELAAAPHSAQPGGHPRQHGFGAGRRRRLPRLRGGALARRHHGQPDARPSLVRRRRGRARRYRGAREQRVLAPAPAAGTEPSLAPAPAQPAPGPRSAATSPESFFFPVNEPPRQPFSRCGSNGGLRSSPRKRGPGSWPGTGCPLSRHAQAGLHHHRQPLRGARDAGVEPALAALGKREGLVEQHDVVPLRALRLVHGQHIAEVELVVFLALPASRALRSCR